MVGQIVAAESVLEREQWGPGLVPLPLPLLAVAEALVREPLEGPQPRVPLA